MTTLTAYLRARAWQRGLTPSEFRRLGLAAKSASEARLFIGGYGAARLALRINRMSNRRGLVADKLLFGATLAGAGLRGAEIHAVFGRPAPPAIRQIQAADDLRAMLNVLEDLPLFGKPLMGQREGGEIAIFGYDDQTDDILTVDGDRVPLSGFWTMLQDHHRARGYLFQPFLKQHPDLVRRVGPVLATVRVVTLYTGDVVQLYRAFWKVPVEDGVTDHPRAGNAAAAVDLKSGRIGSVYRDPTGKRQLLETHPDTGAVLDALYIPHWPKVCDLVAQASGLFHGLPLIGWDVAICPEGPVIVEANTNPSLELPQYLDCTGALAGPGGDALRKLLRRSDRAQRNGRRARRRRRWDLVRGRLGLKRSPTQL